MSTIHSSPVHFIPPSTVASSAGQVLTSTNNTGNSAWQNIPIPQLPPNSIQIFFSKKIGSDITGTGSYTNPYASINFAYASAGSPTEPVFITGLDGEFYDEQLILNSSYKFIIGGYANLNYTGPGDAITVTAFGAGFPIMFSTVSAASGRSIVNTSSEFVVIEVGDISNGDIVNSGAGFILITGQIFGVNFTNTGAGQIFYNINARIGGTDSAGVQGISSGSASGPFSIGGYSYPFGGSTTPGYVLTATAPNVLGFQPVSADIPPNGINIFVSQQIGNDLNTGTYLSPLATFGAAITLAGSPPPTAPVIIVGIDGNQYNEQLVINNPNVYISAPFAQIGWNGVGDTLTINATGSGTLLDIASIANTGGGNALVNNVNETVIVRAYILSNGDVVNNGTQGFLIEADIITINIFNTGGGNVFYDAALRVGTDDVGVYGINALGSTSPIFTVNQFVASGITYPTADAPSNGYVVTRTAPNTLTLQPPSTFSSINTQTFTTSGTYTPTPGMSQCVVEMVGGGGGGGGVDSAAAQSAAAGGGGAGSFVKSLLSAATIGVSQAVTIGAGGAGGAAGNNNGSNGLSTSLGTLMSADGGASGFGASASATVPSIGIFGAGGGSGTGDLVLAGQSGLLGLGYGPAQLGIGGSGGSSLLGTGAEQLVNLAGADGFNYGSGGGGASSGNTGNAAGGNGKDGVVIITEYII